MNIVKNKTGILNDVFFFKEQSPKVQVSLRLSRISMNVQAFLVNRPTIIEIFSLHKVGGSTGHF